MFRYNGADTDWTGFEFENVHGKWRVMDKSFTDMMWRCRLIEPTVEGLAMYEDDALSNWDEDLFKGHVLLGFWATQAQAHIDALEARTKQLQEELEAEKEFAYRHWGESW